MSREERMHQLLMTLNPVSLVIENESGRHAGHAGDNGSGETHYRIEMVAAAFEGKSRIERQRMVNALLVAEFDSGLHALGLTLKSPSE